MVEKCAAVKELAGAKAVTNSKKAEIRDKCRQRRTSDGNKPLP
jgi:hypothetical protein